MLQKIKNIMKRLADPSPDLLNKHMESFGGQLSALKQKIETTNEQIKHLELEIASIKNSTPEITGIKNNTLEIATIKNTVKETLWAQIFNSTIAQSSWLEKTDFSPGRWAVGYNYLYVMYRLLNGTKPHSILELGLGQSTKMISQYADHTDGVTHHVVEQDQEWIGFFNQEFRLSRKTQVVCLPTREISFLEDDRTLVYDGFQKKFEGLKFDFISIDGPGHSRSTLYRRVDLLEIIPDCLGERFVMLFDDTNQATCKKSLQLIEEKLHESGIPFCKGVYAGEKEIILLCDPSQQFLCSL